LRSFASDRAGRAVTAEHRQFWEGIAAECVHPKPLPLDRSGVAGQYTAAGFAEKDVPK
jgi:hypothetical protein